MEQRSVFETAADEADLEEVYSTERHPLYVARTWARDFLLVTRVKPGPEFDRPPLAAFQIPCCDLSVRVIRFRVTTALPLFSV